MCDGCASVFCWLEPAQLLISMYSSYISVSSGLKESLISLSAGIIHLFHSSVLFLVPLHDQVLYGCCVCLCILL